MSHRPYKYFLGQQTLLKNTGAYVRTQNWHKADQVDATGQTGVPGQSDRSGPEAVVATSAPVKPVGPESK
jgi:hypothetical protein